MPRHWRLRINDILDAIDRIQQYVQGLAQAQFEADERTRDAVLYNLQTIGEAVSQLPAEITSGYKEIPWEDIRGMRNLIAHGYFAVKLPIIWKTVTEDLAPLKVVVRKILDKVHDEST
ncbi:MAG: DUF86 domain-containing protein [bacterium]|nr:DUF86 domain-containing protein [bacterium]